MKKDLNARFSITLLMILNEEDKNEFKINNFIILKLEWDKLRKRSGTMVYLNGYPIKKKNRGEKKI